MALDEALAERVRNALAGTRGLSERRMMGGLCFLVNGNMCCGVDDGWLFVRRGRDEAAAVLRRKHAEPMVVGGRTMTGFIKVLPAGLRGTRALASWVVPAAAWAGTLPRKAANKKKVVAKKKTPRARAQKGSRP